MDFGLFFVEQTDEFVVLLDGLHRLDEDGLAGGGRAVDDAGNPAFELGFDRDDKALAADGNDVFLGRAVLAKRANGSAQAGFDGAMLGFHGAADAVEFGAGVVGQAAVGFDFAAGFAAAGRDRIAAAAR